MSVYRLCLVALLFTTTAVEAKPLTNVLAGHASPYLAMHGRDPVHWQEWNAQTVARAKRENKLLFVSSGYFSCHWCHVMQRESYQDPVIAGLLNKFFIPIKVDRELNPALDAKLIDFVEATQGISGWPLNTFVTPQGYPLVGTVYLPPDNFRQLLEKLKDEWRGHRTELVEMAQQAARELTPAEAGTEAAMPAELAVHYRQALLMQTLSLADEMQGGFGQQSKFPSAPQLQVLLSLYARGRDERLGKFLRLTLNQMATQGLRDQLDGGFYRYAVDPGWQVPHFEKMLYDNALLARLYWDAAKVFRHDAYKKIATATLKFMQKQMTLSSGAMLASFSAIDNHNIEGGYYLWNPEEVKKILSSEEWQAVELFWHLQGAPELEHGHHLSQSMGAPQLAKSLAWPLAKTQKILDSASNKLLQQRKARSLPRDTKALAAWNGLALSAFAHAAGQDTAYRQSAKRLRDYLRKELWVGGQLYRARQTGGLRMEGRLEDYAYVAKGLLDWAVLNNKSEDWDWLERVVEQAWKRFYSDRGWRLSEHSLLHYREHQTLLADGPMPSPSATLIGVSYRLAQQLARSELKQRALRAMNAGHDQLTGEAFWYASHIGVILTALE